MRLPAKIEHSSKAPCGRYFFLELPPWKNQIVFLTALPLHDPATAPPTLASDFKVAC